MTFPPAPLPALPSRALSPPEAGADLGPEAAALAQAAILSQLAEGVIVTDSLAMEGVRTLFGDDRVPVEAILPGADQMLLPPDLVVALGGVRAAVPSGEITAERRGPRVRPCRRPARPPAPALGPSAAW